MRNETRQLVRQRFNFCCGYCGVREVDVGAELTVDHFQPRARGGSNEVSNLVYCCHACNEFKSNYWQTEPDLRILHPLHDDLAVHFVEQAEGLLVALTDTGQVTIEVLHLNRKELISHRNARRLHALAIERNTLLLKRLSQLEQDTQTLESRIEHLFSGNKMEG